MKYINTLPIHYIPPYPISCNLSEQEKALRTLYTLQWLNSFDPEVAKLVIANSVSEWNGAHNSTTPYYRTGGRPRY